ncbi:MAG: hypothetical protein QOF13_2041 [Solirubrobacterales bacterium]|nr:hypothetical protein [Solirubrobacterales bacterium]
MPADGAKPKNDHVSNATAAPSSGVESATRLNLSRADDRLCGGVKLCSPWDIAGIGRDGDFR